MRSATSSSLRVCAASAICSANSRLLEARVPVDHDRGPRGICTVPLARPAPRPSASAPLYPSASPCIPFPPCILTSASLCIPLPPHLCTRTFARRERSKTPQSLRDTAIAVYPSTRGVPEQAGSKSAARRRAPPPLTAHLHSHLCGFTSFVRVLPHTIDANPHSSGS